MNKRGAEWESQGVAAELELIRCRGCGAGLGVVPGARHVVCGYCKASTRVRGLGRHAALPARVSAAEGEGLDALRAALKEKYAPGSMTVIALFTLGPMAMVMVSVSWNQVSLALGLPKILGMVVMLVLIVISIIAWMGFLFWIYWRKDPRIEEAMTEVHQRIVREPVPGQCPGCGAPLWVPALNTVLRCCFCQSPLLASEGMLIRWVDNAQARRDAWSAQAGELLRKVQLKERVVGCLSPLIWLVLMFAGTLFLAAFVTVLRFALGLP